MSLEYPQLPQTSIGGSNSQRRGRQNTASLEAVTPTISWTAHMSVSNVHITSPVLTISWSVSVRNPSFSLQTPLTVELSPAIKHCPRSPDSAGFLVTNSAERPRRRFQTLRNWLYL